MHMFIVLSLIGVTCAVPRQLNRIVGGESTPIENYPFMASMLFHSGASLNQFCGGTLVAETSVVSAAHCYSMNDHPASWRVRLGSNLASSGGHLHTVSEIILHEEYNHDLLTNDVAVIRLTNPAVFSNQIKIVRIAGPRYILPDNTLVHVVGWGATEFEGSSSEVLQHVAVYTINHQLCTERYAYLKTILRDMQDVTPEMLCTGILDVGGKDACHGDSGGPVIHSGDVLVGITSWGHECANETYPGVNVRISSYTDWIYSNSIN